MSGFPRVLNDYFDFSSYVEATGSFSVRFVSSGKLFELICKIKSKFDGLGSISIEAI